MGQERREKAGRAQPKSMNVSGCVDICSALRSRLATATHPGATLEGGEQGLVSPAGAFHCDLPSGVRTRIAVLGPMRMQYEKVISSVLQIGRTLETLQS